MLALFPPVASVALPKEVFPAPAKDPITCEKLFKFKLAPELTVTALLGDSVFAAPAFIDPALIVVEPLYVFVPERVKTPEPDLVTPPVPVIFPVKPRSLPLVLMLAAPVTPILFTRVTADAACRVVLSAIAKLPVPRPALLPTAIVPALRVVPPLYVLAPERVKVPAPALVRLEATAGDT